jgi:threonine dehydrogenase-like Zn-dependent dehydrogenase
MAGTFRYPFAYGYSAVGVVERGTADLPEGARVFAFHPHQDRFVASGPDVVPLGGLDPRLGTLFPLVETALQISLDAAPRPGEEVVVLGLGAVGLLSAALLGRAGASVLGVEPRTPRREAARALGLEAVRPEDAADAVAERTGGRGADLAVECSGDPATPAAALGLLRHEGTLWVASWFGTTPVPLPLGAAFHRRRLSIRSTQVSTIPAALSCGWDRARRRRRALALMAELPLGLLATHEFEFERAAEAYAAIDRGEEGLIHAALRYG